MLMNEQLQKAISSLLIENVSLKEMQVITHDNFNPDQIPEDLYSNGQSYRDVMRFESFGYYEDDEPQEGEEELEFYRYTYSIGLRFIPTEQRLLHEQGEIESDELEPLLEFKATFFADYTIKFPLEQDEIDAFAEQHVGFHVWPYWREFLQSSCSRLGLPPLAVKPYIIKQS